jgi:hypothetical protein
MGELDDRVAPYRAAATSDALAAIIDDTIAVRFLAAWRMIPTEWTAPKRDMPSDAAERWRWLWHGVKWDRIAVARAARIAEATANVYAHVCATAQLIYPDGTISTHAADYVRAFTAARYPKRMPGRRRVVGKKQDNRIGRVKKPREDL